MAKQGDGNKIQGIGFSFGMQTGDAEAGGEQEVERPVFRIAVIAEVGARPEFAKSEAPANRPLPVTRATFDDVMREIGTTLALEVDNVFDPGQKPLQIELTLDSFKALKPQGIVDQVPVLAALVQARGVLARVKSASDSAAARDELGRLLPPGRFTDALLRELGTGAAPRAAAPSDKKEDDGLGSLLDKVGFAEPSDTAGSIVASVARAGSRDSSGGAAAANASARVEQTFASLLGSLLEHPEFARLESIWRSLWLLAAEARHDTGVEIELVAVPMDDVASGLMRVAEATHRGPPDLVIVAAEVSPTAHDIEALERWAEIAEGLRAPLIAGGQPGLLGYDTLEDVARSSVRISSSNDPRAVRFKSFAAKDASRWVALTLNRPLARVAYSTQSARIRDMPLPKPGLGGERYLFGAFAIGVLAARSFAHFGIASALTGNQHGKLDDFPVHDWDDRGSVSAIPVETFIPSETQREIARAGLIALASARNHDSIMLSAAPVAFRGESVGKGGDAPAPIGLGDQLFVGRFSYAVEQLAGAMPASTDPSVIADTARVVLHGFFTVAPPAGPEVHARAAGGMLEVTVRPRRYAGVSLEEVTLHAPLAG